MLDKDKLNEALRNALFGFYKQIDNRCSVDYEPLDDEDYGEITEMLIEELDERPIVKLDLMTVEVKPQVIELEFVEDEEVEGETVVINKCEHCEAPYVGGGDSLHCWDAQYECGGSIIGAFGMDGHIEDKPCPNKK